MSDNKSTSYMIMRVAIGIMFLFYGIGKITGGVGGFADHIYGEFGQTWLPTFMLTLFAYSLPFLEILVGSLLVTGLFTRIGLIIGSFVTISLTFGSVVIVDSPTVADNIFFVFVLCLLIWFVEYNQYSLDNYWRGEQIESFAEAY